MFDFDEIKNTEDDENIEDGGSEENAQKKKTDDTEDWGIEEDLENEEN